MSEHVGEVRNGPDRRGKRYGRLLVIALDPQSLPKKRKWICRCDCGREVSRGRPNHTTGMSVQCCGLCYRQTHGGSKEKLYQVWAAMKHRCSPKYSARFPRYAGRGIRVCEEWGTYQPFQSWALKNGYRDGLEIDRVNNDGNYDALNCRWVTCAENQWNKPSTKLTPNDVAAIRTALAVGGARVGELARRYGVSSGTISNLRRRHKWKAVLPAGATP